MVDYFIAELEKIIHEAKLKGHDKVFFTQDYGMIFSSSDSHIRRWEQLHY